MDTRVKMYVVYDVTMGDVTVKDRVCGPYNCMNDKGYGVSDLQMHRDDISGYMGVHNVRAMTTHLLKENGIEVPSVA